MPYVNKKERDDADYGVSINPYFIHHLTKGQLNYVITKILNEWSGTEAGYQRLSDAIAAANDAAAEFRRRRLDPHEDMKARENGDVYAGYVRE